MIYIPIYVNLFATFVRAGCATVNGPAFSIGLKKKLMVCTFLSRVGRYIVLYLYTFVISTQSRRPMTYVIGQVCRGGLIPSFIKFFFFIIIIFIFLSTKKEKRKNNIFFKLRFSVSLFLYFSISQWGGGRGGEGLGALLCVGRVGSMLCDLAPSGCQSVQFSHGPNKGLWHTHRICRNNRWQ